ncbi:CsbD family protein [Streptomyces sp. NPDC059909]|uniref:CsbD family protein n=1 Tax=Streptomyces sp. NPDC059909 TaxID=3346998 RepID=UPI00366412AC
MEKKIRGKVQETMGKAKQKAGRMAGHDELHRKGTGDRVKGVARQVAGKTEEVVHKAATEARAKIRKHQ